MTAKQQTIKAVEALPEDASREDIRERIEFIAGVQRGLAELEAGKGIDHASVMKEMAGYIRGEKI